MRSQPIKVVMVGDCASVGETLIHYAPDGVEYQHLTRTRGVYSKTIGIVLSVLRSRGDVYHVHYGLQDHFITKILKHSKPTICHVHGSDLRFTIKGSYGWIVKRNLRTADKVIVAVPDILGTAKSYRQDAEYVSNPANFDVFRPAPPDKHGKEFRVLFASALSFVKGAGFFAEKYANYQKANTNSVLYAIRYGENQSEIISLLCKLGVRFRLLEPVPHCMMPSLYHSSDVVATDFQLGYLHMTSLEAMACYRPVVQYIDRQIYSRMRIPLPPVVKAGIGIDLKEELEKLHDQSTRDRISREQETYVKRHHNPIEISRRIADIYHEVIRDN